MQGTPRAVHYRTYLSHRIASAVPYDPILNKRQQQNVKLPETLFATPNFARRVLSLTLSDPALQEVVPGHKQLFRK